MLTLTDTIDLFEQEDTIDSLTSLKTKFLSNETPSGFVLNGEPVDEKLVFVKFSPELPPKVVKSVIVFDNLNFVAYDNDQTIPRHVFERSMNFSNQILRFSDFQNLLVYVNNY